MGEKEQKIEDWWMPHQVELVMDHARVWQKQVFKPTAGVWLPSSEGRLLGRVEDHPELPAGAIIEERAWDHEHCELCFTTISDQGDNEKVGYFDGKKWICTTCHNTYILPFRK